MSQKSNIQWCDSTINPVMGCEGCELYSSPGDILNKFREKLLFVYPHLNDNDLKTMLRHIFENRTVTEMWHERRFLITAVIKAEGLPEKDFKAILAMWEKEIKCYAAHIHFRYGGDHTQLNKKGNKGYAPAFEHPTLFPGRTAIAAGWKDLIGTDRSDSPWINGLPRLIFVSDMGDALSSNVSLEYLRTEIVDCAASQAGRRHIWLWLTKRPKAMAKFSAWLEQECGVGSWPDNLVAMTSVTSKKTAWRVDELRKVRARFRGLSVEPLWSNVTLNLDGVSWVICGGESGSGAEPFDLSWAKFLHKQSKEAGASFFLKQLGAVPLNDGTPVKLNDKHGGDWSEWPDNLRTREFPAAWYSPLNSRLPVNPL